MRNRYSLVHTGPRYQRGAGLGSIFGSIFRTLIPVIGRVGKAAAKTGIKLAKSQAGRAVIKKAKRELKQTGINLASNIATGQDVGQGLKKDLKRASQRVANTIVRTQQLRTRGLKPTTTLKIVIKKKKKKTKPSFKPLQKVKRKRGRARRGEKLHSW